MLGKEKLKMQRSKRHNYSCIWFSEGAVSFSKSSKRNEWTLVKSCGKLKSILKRLFIS